MTLEFIETTQENIFVTGKAGTGKSTLLMSFRESTKRKVAVLAPTGVAALNVQGQTIHSFFRFKPNMSLEDIEKKAGRLKGTGLYQNLDTIILDEISMVRADLLDSIDAFLRTVLKTDSPFGGKQMIFIGDLYQLPPVVSPAERPYFSDVYATPYFFSAHVMSHPEFKLRTIELEKIYRQTDDAFIELLNAIRHNSVTELQIDHLNTRLEPQPDDAGYIHLTSTNRQAEKINIEKLAQLPSRLEQFDAEMEGEFNPKDAPTETQLKLKIGAQVMFLNNDSAGRWVNGTIGEIVDIGETIDVMLPIGFVVPVMPHKWSMIRYAYDKNQRQMTKEPVGSFTQYPIKLAWAITIHKSQGKTFDKVIVDLERGTFAHGQAYVALSRCRTFEGLVLKHPFRKSHVIVDYRVLRGGTISK